MINLQRLGVVLQPPTQTPRTVANFNASMILAGDVVHMVYRCTEWRLSYDDSCQSYYALDELR
jgi:hypothetical protein